MQTYQVLPIILEVSSFISLIALMVYLYYVLQSRSIERSIRQIVDGEGLFNPDKVLEILKQFTDDNARLKALKQLANHDTVKAEAFLKKVKANIDVNSLNQSSTNYYKSISGRAALFFLLLALSALAYYLINPTSPPIPPTPKVDARFDIKFADSQFFKVKNKIRAEITLNAISLTNKNNEVATAFIGMITAHTEDLIELNQSTQNKLCKETPSCLGVKNFRQNIIIRGGNNEPTNLRASFDLPVKVKYVRFYAEFYQKEANNGVCVIADNQNSATDGIPLLKVISKDGIETKDSCFGATDKKLVFVKI